MWIRKVVTVLTVLLLVVYGLYIISRYSKGEIIKTSPDISQAVDWAPTRKAIDKWKNTAPFLHCPHGSNRRVELLEMMNSLASSQNSSFCSCPTDVTFLLLTNLAADVSPVSEQLYKLCGCRYVHIRLNKTAYPGWQFSYKVSPLLQWFESDGHILSDDSYVMSSDAFDTGLIGDASKMVESFLEYDCKILGMSTVADWPPNKEFKLFEEEKYPWSKCRPYLSSGAWMARVPDAKFFVQEWENDWKSRGSRIEDRKNQGSEKGWDDQMGFRRLHKRFYPSFKVDTMAKVWTRCDTGYNCL